jgi:hypothetical protein
VFEADKYRSLMAIKRLTTDPTEADLEAEFREALKFAFPWLPAGSLRHQTKFSFRFGRATVNVDGATASQVEGRADILVQFNEDPLAVVELKRGGKALSADDEEQGLSYARMLHPRPPLVVVTNGSETRIFETHTGEKWEPSDPSDAELKKLIEAASRVANVDTKRAVEVLLGPGSKVWADAVRGATEVILDDLSGAWDQPLLPFVRDFYIPRKATAIASYLLQLKKRIVVVEGPPLAGKSSVLRELAHRAGQSDETCVLFVEADTGSAPGIFRQLANLLSATLAWSVTPDEVRRWLQRLSKLRGPSLVLAIDGVTPDRDDIRTDIDELTSQVYGQNLQIVISADDTIVESFIKNITGRKASALGRKAVRIQVGPLDDEEFDLAQSVLWEQRMGFTEGARNAPEMRSPWVLRTLAAEIVSAPEYRRGDLVAALPPMLGLDLVAQTRSRFEDDQELRRKFQAIARTVLADSSDRTRPIGLILESMATFVVRRESLIGNLDPREIDGLIKHGLLKPSLHESGEAILVVRLPELVISELAAILASELEQRVQADPEAAAEWLSHTSALVPLGDIVGAQALFDVAERGGVTLNLISALLSERPRQETIGPGTKAAMHMPGIGVVKLTFREDGALVIDARGFREVVPASPDDRNSMSADLESWLLLSHLAARQFIAQSADGKNMGRIDAALLLELGACPIVLRRPGRELTRRGILTHSLSAHGEIVCHRSGIVEPITMAIYRFLGSEGPQAKRWIDEAVCRDSFPLLNRIDLALRQFLNSADTDKAKWAANTRENTVLPALKNYPLVHDESEE